MNDLHNAQTHTLLFDLFWAPATIDGVIVGSRAECVKTSQKYEQGNSNNALPPHTHTPSEQWSNSYSLQFSAYPLQPTAYPLPPTPYSLVKEREEAWDVSGRPAPNGVFGRPLAKGTTPTPWDVPGRVPGNRAPRAVSAKLAEYVLRKSCDRCIMSRVFRCSMSWCFLSRSQAASSSSRSR